MDNWEESKLSSERAAIHLRDLQRVNEAAERLNAEAEDALKYQTIEEPGKSRRKPKH